MAVLRSTASRTRRAYRRVGGANIWAMRTPIMRTSMQPAAVSCANSARPGWLRYGVGGTAYGGHGDTIDTRAVCLLRETLARHSGLADFALAMQGLGSGAISLGGTQTQEAALPAACRERRGHRGVCADRTRCRLGRRGARAQRAAKTATPMCSTARRPGSRTAASPIFTWCSPEPAKRRARAASARSSSMPIRRDCASPNAST